ncbi:chromosome segregation and condensation protein ScpB [Bradyrhizobium sp. USDA 10063]
MLARVVGRDCNLDLVIDDIREELRGRPYELVSVAGGWQHRTRKNFGDVIRAAIGGGEDKSLSQSENLERDGVSLNRLRIPKSHRF